MGSNLPYRSLPQDQGNIQQPHGLKIIIVGGGIGGLSAAIALRQQNHIVDVYESSGFSKEVGAALNICPNANSILRRLGISGEKIGANLAEWMAEWTYTGTRVKKIDILAIHKVHAYRYRLGHRIKLHNALRLVATDATGAGPPAKLHLSMPVRDVDAANGIVYFKDGTSVQGDVVIGADGVHSITRTKLPGGDMQPFPSGLSAFRFLVPMEAVLSDPTTAKFAEDTGTFNGIFAPDRSIITYPTNDNTMVNFVCIHPDSVLGRTDSWGNNTSVAKLLEVYKEFHPDFLALLGKADEGSLKIWQLLDMEKTPTWSHGRLCVMGDAAHPFMPFLGQGAAIAIEDAVALGVVLEPVLDKDEVPERLRLYQSIRKERAELVQHYTRLSGKARGEKSSFDAARYQGYCFGYDEWDNSTQKLREWKWSKLNMASFSMDTVFGPTPTPRQSEVDKSTTLAGPTFTSASIRFNTSRTVLDGFLPPGNKAFCFKSFGSIGQCTIRHMSYRGLPELAGKSHDVFGLLIHGVEYTDTDGNKFDGAFLPLLFDNSSAAVLASQKDQKIATVESTIDIERDSTSYHIRTGWRGLTWGNFYLEGLQPMMASTGVTASNPLPDASKSDKGTILHRYIMQKGGDQSVGQQKESVKFVPTDVKSATDAAVTAEDKGTAVGDHTGAAPSSTWRATSAQFNIRARDSEAYPTIHHIISRLQELPIISVIEAKVSEGSGTPNFF